jgi:translation initiation factor 2 subunit 3
MTEFTVNKVKLTDIIKKQPIVTYGTIGHVSHGKSTVIYAITGKKTQAHSAEQIRNITINLGYANTKIWYNEETDEFKTTNSDIELDSSWKLVQHFSFVDCPGHNKYLSTMISGTEAMNGVIAVISGADETFPQPQTVEHIAVINKLKIAKLLIVQNKLDIIDKKRALENYDQIKEFFTGSRYETAPIIPTSAANKLNTDSIIKWLTQQKPKDLIEGSNRIVFNIIRSFDVNTNLTPIIDMKGGVIGGILKEGILTVGDYVEIKPGFLVDGKPKKLYAKVLEIHSEKNKLDFAIPGGLIGVQLDIDPFLTKNDKMVGQIMGYNIEDYKVYQTFELKLKSLKGDDCFEKLDKNKTVYINVNSRTVEATIDKVKDKKIKVTTKYPIVINNDSRISIIIKNDDGCINCDFYGTLNKGDEIECIFDSEYKEIYDSYKLPTYEIIDDLDNHEFDHEFNYDELLENIKFENVMKKYTHYLTPTIEFKNKYSQFVNFIDCLNYLHKSYPKEGSTDFSKDILDFNEIKLHLIDFIKEEIMKDVIENSIGLKIRGKYTDSQFFTIYKNYMDKHYMCTNCKNFKCYLIKIKKNIHKLCTFCNKVVV